MQGRDRFKMVSCIHPLLHKCIPNMLRKIGFVIFLFSLSRLLNSIFQVILIESLRINAMNTTLCSISQHNQKSLLLNVCLSQTHLYNGFGIIIMVPTTLEFSMAQTPCNVRGLIISVLTLSCGISAGLSVLLYHILKHTFGKCCPFFGDNWIICNLSVSIETVQVTQKR